MRSKRDISPSEGQFQSENNYGRHIEGSFQTEVLKTSHFKGPFGKKDSKGTTDGHFRPP